MTYSEAVLALDLRLSSTNPSACVMVMIKVAVPYIQEITLVMTLYEVTLEHNDASPPRSNILSMK